MACCSHLIVFYFKEKFYVLARVRDVCSEDLVVQIHLCHAQNEASHASFPRWRTNIAVCHTATTTGARKAVKM